MLLAKTVVKPSHIAGMGLFADEDIKKGQVYWRYNPNSCLIVTREHLNALLQSYHKTEDTLIRYYLTYGYYAAELDGLVVCLDNARFVNHADEPNCAGPFDPQNRARDLAWQCSVALKDIKKGEEITEDYTSYDSAAWLDDLCQNYEIFHQVNSPVLNLS